MLRIKNRIRLLVFVVLLFSGSIVGVVNIFVPLSPGNPDYTKVYNMDLQSVESNYQSTKDYEEIEKVANNWEPNYELSSKDFTKLGISVANYNFKEHDGAVLKWIYLDQNYIYDKTNGILYLEAIIEAHKKRYSLMQKSLSGVEHIRYIEIKPYIDNSPSVEIIKPEKWASKIDFDATDITHKAILNLDWNDSIFEKNYISDYDFRNCFKNITTEGLEPESRVILEKWNNKTEKYERVYQEELPDSEIINRNLPATYRITYAAYYYTLYQEYSNPTKEEILNAINFPTYISKNYYLTINISLPPSE